MACILALLFVSSQYCVAANAERVELLAKCDGPRQAVDRVVACTSLLELDKASPKDMAFDYFFRGLAQADLKKLEVSIDDLNNSIRFNPGFWPSRWARANLTAYQRHYEEAAKDWTIVIQFQPTLSAPHSQLSNNWYNLSKFDESLIELNKAIEMAEPKVQLSLYYADRGLIYEGLRAWDKAILDYSESIRRDEKSYNPYYGRGRVEFL